MTYVLLDWAAEGVAGVAVGASERGDTQGSWDAEPGARASQNVTKAEEVVVVVALVGLAVAAGDDVAGTADVSAGGVNSNGVALGDWGVWNGGDGDGRDNGEDGGELHFDGCCVVENDSEWFGY